MSPETTSLQTERKRESKRKGEQKKKDCFHPLEFCWEVHVSSQQTNQTKQFQQCHCSRISCRGCLLAKFHFCPDHCCAIRTFSEGKFREGEGWLWGRGRREDKGSSWWTGMPSPRPWEPVPPPAPNYCLWRTWWCSVFNLLTLSAREAEVPTFPAHAGLYRKQQVKWVQWSHSSLRLLSTSLSDCTAWHRPGWVSSLWSWEARPGIAVVMVGWGG